MHYMGMDITWPHSNRELGDKITFTCPSNTMTMEQNQTEQTVSCIWHRQTDTMVWWPQEIKTCDSKYCRD